MALVPAEPCETLRFRGHGSSVQNRTWRKHEQVPQSYIVQARAVGRIKILVLSIKTSLFRLNLVYS